MSELQTILDAPIAGNAYHDNALMNRIHTFVMSDSNDMKDKIEAIKKLDEVMGMTQDEVTSNDVENYIAES